MTDLDRYRKAIRRVHRASAMVVVATLLGAPLMGTPASAAAQTGLVKSVSPQTSDGDEQYFAVRCTDGRETSVIINAVTDMVCHYPPQGPQQCATARSIADASALACGGQPSNDDDD